MDFIISARTDVGLRKHTNQDSYAVRVYNTRLGKIAFAVLCDGMGGLAKGEIASASLVHAFCEWADERLPFLCEEGLTDQKIREEWVEIALDFNEKIKQYGMKYGVSMGTTVTAMLITEKRYYIINVGDTRAYAIGEQITVLTKDQTLVAREVELGNLTPEQAERDARRSILLQCIGASENVYPDLFFGDTKENMVYMLCSDGFRHTITSEEIFQYMNPKVMEQESVMGQNMEYLIGQNKQRQERDNITVLAIRTR